LEFLERKTNLFIKNLKRPAHGGNIFEKFSKNMDDWKDLIDFSTNINPLGPSKEALKIIQNNLWQIPYYPESNSQLLREEISNFFDNIILSEEIIVCSGLTELINLTAEVFIKPNSKVLIPVPTYGEYNWAIKKYGGTSRTISLKPEENFRMNVIIKYLTREISALYICNPNNPTARLEDPNIIEKIVETAGKNEILVFIDEAFIDYCNSDSSFVFKLNQYPNVVIFRSFTKFYALSGLRIGYGVANKKIIEILMKAKLSWNVNCLAQIAAIHSLRDIKYKEETLRIMKREREFLLSALKKINLIKVYPSDTGFILFQLNSNLDPKKFEAKLFENKIMIRNCGNFRGLDNSYFRIGIKVRKDNEKLINCIKQILENTPIK